MSTLKFEIQHPNGQRELVVIDGEGALVGSGSHCDVRLPIDDAPPELLRVDVQGGVLCATVIAAVRQVTLADAPFSGGWIGANAVLGIGRTRLSVALVSDSKHAPTTAARTKSRSVMPIVALTICALVGYSFFDAKTSKSRDPLFDIDLFVPPPATCPHANQQEALAYAAEQLDLANGKRERMPFVAQEGLAAAALYYTSATCYRQGGASESAREAKETAETIERDLTNEFRARCLRLNRMLELDDYELVQRDLTVLLSLTHGKRGPAVDWLKGVAKELKSKGMQ